MSTTIRQRLLTVQEVADYLQVTTEFVYRVARAGQIKSVRVGRCVRFKPEQVAEYVESCERGT